MTDPLEQIEMIPIAEVAKRVGFSRSMIYVLIKEDGFPEPIKTRSASRWCPLEIYEWKQRKKAERPGASRAAEQSKPKPRRERDNSDLI
ncbi:hypothetical protein Q669_29370 [Labrenzia sp. C1B10]|uniref:helix-turn-helix transcriptional regulator n=1 Tax=unclassified Labrenzia TaxID=2648686 RepID=UPI0003B8BB8C|nr:MULTISPECIES: AlpA family phage regulatory protein [unclassified Labrenzia]ERP95685.1 hypothetical protein Q669_29370 [Labrenzia sp. C1B10]ERS05751.1 hypothetical protein Q675_28935 [Labrenzia sp. C1B70]